MHKKSWQKHPPKSYFSLTYLEYISEPFHFNSVKKLNQYFNSFAFVRRREKNSISNKLTSFTVLFIACCLFIFYFIFLRDIDLTGSLHTHSFVLWLICTFMKATPLREVGCSLTGSCPYTLTSVNEALKQKICDLSLCNQVQNLWSEILGVKCLLLETDFPRFFKYFRKK